MTLIKKAQRNDSSDANVCKYILEFEGAVAEAVLYKYPTYEERTVMCISTQSGCPIGCRFCGAGDAFVRSLRGEEIVAQVDHMLRDKGIDLNACKKAQIMVMSMGEPLLNRAGLLVAFEILHARFPDVALLISTSAPDVDYGWVNQMSQNIPKVGLQFSVHESTDVARDALIPFKAKLNLQQIAEKGVEWHRATGRRPYFNYCAHPDNTSEEDADRLLELFNPYIWEATVSVICERDESISAANRRQRELATDFMGLLVARGFSVRCFDPAGQDDIGGGCGQLHSTQKWMADNPHLTHRSAGSKLPKVHTPLDNIQVANIE